MASKPWMTLRESHLVHCLRAKGEHQLNTHRPPSDRWLRPDASHPDDTENHKARAIGEFTRWRQSWVMRDHGFRPNILYWLDYSCLDQDDLEVVRVPAPSVPITRFPGARRPLRLPRVPSVRGRFG